jgi:hypothetical protein
MKSLAGLGRGGAGLHDQLPGVLQELQGLTFSVLAASDADTKIDLAAIRQEDTVVSAIHIVTGDFVDETANITISDTHASGTIALSTAVAGNTVTLNGKLYTAVAGAPASNEEFSIDTSDTAAATSLAAAINAREANGANAVTATSSTGTVTVRATADGVAGNAITLTKVGDPITVSGSTLSGGTATGGVECSNATGSLVLVWFNKQ